MRSHVNTGSVTTWAIWCRVSKTEQETANQLDELAAVAQRNGFEVTRGYVFEVTASNGSARHREMLGQALADARLGRFEVMLVWDRVSREGVEATLAILRRFAGHGTAVVVTQGTVDRDGGSEDDRAARVAVRLDGRLGVPPSFGADQSRAGAP
jgi:DNA invertase Pin-like site-specific DNA recombinase